MKDGLTAAMLAFRMNYLECFDILLSSGAHFDFKEKVISIINIIVWYMNEWMNEWISKSLIYMNEL